MSNEETKGQAGEGESKGSCCASVSKCCGGKKALLGGLVGLVLAGTGFGLYHAGKCAGKVCPVAQTQK